VFMLERHSSLLVRPLRFLIVGGINTLLGLSIIYVLIWAFHLHDVWANLIGYGIGIAVSFLLNARWTFSFRGPFGGAAWRFVAIVGLGYLANLATVSVCLHGLSLPSFIAQAAGVLPYALVTYLGSKFFVFVQRLEPKSVADLKTTL
jgi:putative flippase GtrA